MEDLAHFIQSMSEKYGLLDAGNKDSRELLNLAGNKQIQECSSSAASNSCNNEDCSAQASSWEYLSIFISGQTLDSKASFGSRNLHPTPGFFNSGNDSHLHAYASMIDINEEPELESPLPTTSHVVIKEHEDNDFFVERGSMAEPGQNAPYEKDFSDVVTMSDYLQSVYCCKEGGEKLLLTDKEALSGMGELQEMTCKSGGKSSREDSTSPLGDHRRNDEFHSRDLKECSQSGGSRSRSHHIEGDNANSAHVEVGRGQYGAKYMTSPTGDMHRQYGSWNSALADSEPRCEDTSSWTSITTSSNVKSSAGASEQPQPRSRRQRGVVSSFVGLDDEAEFGDSVALHEYAVSSGGSSSRSCRTEGGGTDTDGREEGYDDGSKARLNTNLRDGNSNNRLCDFSSNTKQNEEEEKYVGGCSSSSNNRGGAHHNVCDPLEEDKRGSGSSYDRSSKLAGTQEHGGSVVQEQVREAGLGLSSGIGSEKTKQKSGYSMLGDREPDRRGDRSHSRNHDFGAAQQEGHFRLRDQDRERGVGSSHGSVHHFGGLEYADSMPGLHETEQGKVSFHNRSRRLGGPQHRTDDSIPRVEERERRDGSSDGRGIEMEGKRDGLEDIIRVRDKEQTISFQGRDNNPAGVNEDNSTHRAQEKQPGGSISFGRFANLQGGREDFCDSLNEDHKKRDGGGSSNYRVNTFEQCSNDSKIGEQESERRCVSKESRATHAGNQEKLETSVRGVQESQRRGAQEKRAKNGEMQDGFDSLNDLLHGEKPGDIFSSSQALSSSGMHSRSLQLDDATENLFTDSAVHTFPFQSKPSILRTSKYARQSTVEAPSENARSFIDFSYLDEDVEHNLKSSCNSRPTKNVEVKNRRPQTPVSMMLPNKNFDASCTSLEEARFVESWDLGEDLNLPSSASKLSGSITSKWVYINNILCDNGFSPLDNSCTIPSPETFDKIFDTLSDVVRNFARREKLVQELLAERESLRQEEQLNDQLTVRLESEIDMLKHKLAASEQRAELATAASEKTFAALRKEHQRLEASHASMLQRCSQLEHVCRAKERSLRKHQEKIQEAVRREQSQRSRDKELYEKLKHKVALSQKAQGEIIESNFLLRDLKPACIVGIYERQRAANEAEMNHLREENSRLCKELREKENSLLVKAMSAVEADQAELDQREQDLIQQLTEIDKQLTKKVSQCRQLECREDSALLPLAVNQKDDLKKENINHHVPLKSDSAENKSTLLLLQRLQLDAEQERRNHQLLQEISKKKLEYSTTSSTCQTSIVSGCTSLKCQELLQDVCSKLKITDPLRITDAIDSLLKVVAAVPRMESFIDNVCEVVFNEGYMFLTGENPLSAEQTPEAIPEVLKFWLQQLQSSAELQQFKDSVCTQLWERFDDKAENQSMNCKLAGASIKDLINIERQYLLSQQSYREAQTLLKAEPQKLLHRIIGHFQMLFEIPQLEGVMAVMNSVYIQISEYHNFARALCSMLSLPKDSGANTIISTVTGILNKVLSS